MSIHARRHSPRVRLSEAAHINFESGNRGVILDVSEGGLRFATTAPLEESAAVRFRLAIHERSEGLADLAWSDESRTTGGLRFTSVPREIREQIRDWIDRAEWVPPRDVQEPPANVEPAGHEVEAASPPSMAVEQEPEFSSAVAASELQSARSAGDLDGARVASREEHTFLETAGAEDPLPEPLAARETESTAESRRVVSGSFGSHGPTVVEEQNRLTMFPSENVVAGDRPLLTIEPQSHRVAVAFLVFLFGLAGAGAAVAYYYPGQTRDAMSRIQAKVARLINLPLIHPAPKPPASTVEPAAIGETAAGNPGFADALEPAPAAADTGGVNRPGLGPKGDAASPSSAAGAATLGESGGPKPASPAPLTSTKSSSQAELDLARTYLSDGSTADEKAKAVHLLWLATEKGNIDAEMELADLYARGESVPQNCQQARILLKVAAAANPALAQPKLARFDSSGCR